MRVAIVGSRDCGNFSKEHIIKHLPASCTLIISGGARGVDTFAMEAAKHLDIPFVRISPDYEKNGKAAPHKRNALIIDTADLLLAFWDFSSQGTANAIAGCIESGVPVRVIGLDE